MTAITPKQYKIGDELMTSGKKVLFIVRQTDRAGVFLIGEDRIRWEFYADHVVLEAVRHAISKYEALWYEVVRSTRKELRRPLILWRVLCAREQSESRTWYLRRKSVRRRGVQYPGRNQRAIRSRNHPQAGKRRGKF